MWIIYVFDDSCHYILRQGLCLLSHGITGRCWVLGIQTEVPMHAQQVLYPAPGPSPHLHQSILQTNMFFGQLYLCSHGALSGCLSPDLNIQERCPVDFQLHLDQLNSLLSSTMYIFTSRFRMPWNYSLLMSVPDCPSLCY